MTRFLWDDAGFEPDPRTPKTKRQESAAPKPPAPGSDPGTPVTVTQLNTWIAAAIDEKIKKIWIAGEISDYSQPRSGHIYLTLKDETSQIRAVIWRSAAERLKFQLEDGQSVIGYGRVDVYSPRGSYQIVLDKVEPQGIGALQLAFRQLHDRMAKQGFFDLEKKRPLPAFPRRLGFVTSPSGAALQDFLEVAKRRWPGIEIIVIPSRVQGEGAADEIAKGIEIAQRLRPKLDVLVVGRGGGSMEDLWCFNEEVVVRAIASSKIPTVSAVGHEIDVTLCDLAADLRALTPSEAAERILPSQEELHGVLANFQGRMARAMLSMIEHYRIRLDGLRHRPVLMRPDETIQRRIQRLDELNLRLDQAVDRRLVELRHRLATQAATLEALSPIRTLHRGYSISRDLESGRIIRDASMVKAGQTIETQIEDSLIESVVSKVRK
ncbi:MAG: exodeoxyribonuclease VII large subunit [Pirellulaceae bacterium]|nr:exodeoxyribonuclease VII large subunit [Pirellulaceae bacterium]